MVSWDIPGTATVGQAGHTSDHNLITTALEQAVKLLPATYNVVYYGADPTGDTDSTSAFEAVQTAIGSSAATVYIPAGTYKTSTFLSLIQNQNIIGDGSSSVTVNYTGSTTALTINISGAFTGGENAGTVSGFSLSAYDATGTPNGCQFGNLQGLNMTDVAFYGFDGFGIYGLNASSQWAEENNIRAIVVQCGTAVVLNGGSYDYSNFDFLIVTGPGQGGLTIENSTQLQGCSIRIRGNFYIAETNTAAVIAVEPSGTGASYISNSLFDVAVENAPATDATSGYVGHYTVYMNSTNQESNITNCTGVLSFANIATTSGDAVINFQGAYNPNNLPFGFSGVINDTVLGIMNEGDGLVIMGGTDYVVQDGTSDTLYESTIFFEFGDIQPFLLNSGTNTLVFDGVTSGTGGFAKQVTLIVKQPTAGTSTLKMPSNVHGPSTFWSGTNVNIATGNGAVTKIRMTYIPADNLWYAEIAGSGYVAS